MDSQTSVQITPKYIVSKLIELWKMLKKNWLLVLIIAAIGGYIGFMIDAKKRHRTTYPAKITFSVMSGGQNDMMGLGSMFGMSQPVSDATLFSGDNFMFIAKTRATVMKAVLRKVKLGQREDTFYNIYTDSSYIKEDVWIADYMKPLHTGRLTKTDRNKMSVVEITGLDDMVNRLIEETELSKPDPKLSFMVIEASCERPALSKLWVETLLATIEDLYQTTQTRKTRQMITIMQRRVDSLGYVLNRTENRLAKVSDVNIDAVAIQGKVEQTKLTRNSGFVTGLFMEASRSLENLRMSLVKETPLFTIIEPVYMPLAPEYYIRKNTIFGTLIGIIVAFFIAFWRQAYLELKREEKKG